MRCVWCDEPVRGRGRTKWCSDICKKRYKFELRCTPGSQGSKSVRSDRAVQSSRRYLAPAEQNATNLHLGSDGTLMTRGSSTFYNPTHTLAEAIQDSLDPDRVVSSRGEVIEDNSRSLSEARDHDDADMIALSYRVVRRRTEKALLVAIGGRAVWLPRSQIEFVPGNIVKVPRGIARSKGLIYRHKPSEY